MCYSMLGASIGVEYSLIRTVVMEHSRIHSNHLCAVLEELVHAEWDHWIFRNTCGSFLKACNRRSCVVGSCFIIMENVD